MSERSHHGLSWRTLAGLLATCVFAADSRLHAQSANVATPPPSAAAACSGTPVHEVRVLTPAHGSSIRGDTKLTVCARGMTALSAHAWHAPDAAHTAAIGYDATIASVAPDANGYAELVFPAARFPRGPSAIVIEARATALHSDTAYLQVVNEVGVPWKEGIPTVTPRNASPKRLVYQDDFKGPLSISRTGRGATYASAKPDGPNGTEFGDAIFGDHAGSDSPFSIVSNQYLRIRAAKLPPGQVDPLGWGRTHRGGMLSSCRTDGTGLAVKYGYFEARMLAPHGKGGWPAFWLLSQASLLAGPQHAASTSEIDVTELYTHDPKGSCSAHHLWGVTPEIHHTQCVQPYAFSDNAATWHVYGVNVTPREIIYYVDDHEVTRRPTDSQAKGPMYFLINLALGGGWPIDLARYGDQIDLFVDYVRVFQ